MRTLNFDIYIMVLLSFILNLIIYLVISFFQSVCIVDLFIFDKPLGGGGIKSKLSFMNWIYACQEHVPLLTIG